MTETLGSVSRDKYSGRQFRLNEPRLSFKDSLKLQERHRSLAKSTLDYEKEKLMKLSKGSFENRSQSQNKEYHSEGPTTKKEDNQITNNPEGSCVLDNQTNPLNSALLKKNSKLHDSDFCVCDFCTCGRHLCKIHINKPKLSINSNYRRDFNSKSSIHNFLIRHGQSPSIQGRITPMSTYGKDFHSKIHPVDSRYKPQDCIKDEGPFVGLTTYGNGFPDYRSDMTYPKGKNTGGEHVSNTPFMGNSTYRKEFLDKKVSHPSINQVKDNLRSGDSFLGDSTYRTNFPKYDTSYVNPWLSKKSSLNDPGFNHQYETTYRNDYLKNKPTVCPAKIQLQTRSKGFFRNSKMGFLQNSDYKALDPEFHALSTSKIA